MLRTINKLNLIKLIQNNVLYSSQKIVDKTLENNGNKNNLKITLISDTTNVSFMTLLEAQQLSIKKDLKLVKVVDFDAKTRRPVYKLMTSSDYFEEDLKRRLQRKEARKEAHIKGEKLMSISTKTSQHDIDTRLRNIGKWLNKHYEVKVVINGNSNNPESMEKLFSDINQSIKEHGKITQKQTKDCDIKFHIIPFLNKDNTSAPVTDEHNTEIHNNESTSKTL